MDDVTRRSFLKNTSSVTGYIALNSILPDSLVSSIQLIDSDSTAAGSETISAFELPGGCSQSLFYFMNRDFGNPLANEERAADLLSGGLLYQSQQCGMLWGSSLAVGAEASRRYADPGQAMGVSVEVTQKVMDSFLNHLKSIKCREITNCNFASKISMVKYFLTGKFIYCLKMIGKWAPHAYQAALEGLQTVKDPAYELPVSCASEVVRKMGGSEAEMVTVSGFAGGLGLSGAGCGALAAAVWMKSLNQIRHQRPDDKVKFPSKEVLNVFYDTTAGEMECHKICSRHFDSVADHSEFIKNGGCEKLLSVLADIDSN